LTPEREGGRSVQEDDNPIFEGIADPTGPFGNPDGSRAPIENILSNFVDFRGNPAFGALATRQDDATTRVIVGRLGAGKTVYLRRLRNFQARQESVFADHPQQNLPPPRRSSRPASGSRSGSSPRSGCRSGAARC
jgi:hypothetical protein